MTGGLSLGVPREGAGAVTEAELMAHCRSLLADFKCPKTIYIVEAIPRTATGKIQRRNVAAAITKGL